MHVAGALDDTTPGQRCGWYAARSASVCPPIARCAPQVSNASTSSTCNLIACCLRALPVAALHCHFAAANTIGDATGVDGGTFDSHHSDGSTEGNGADGTESAEVVAAWLMDAVVQCMTPPHPPGLVAVEVSTNGGADFSRSGNQLEFTT